MKPLFIILALLLSVSSVFAQKKLDKLDLEEGEEVYRFSQGKDLENMLVFTFNAHTEQYFIHSNKRKFGPYNKIAYHTQYGIPPFTNIEFVKKADGYFLFYNDAEYGPFDSIPSNGAIALSPDRKQVVFQIIENDSSYLINSLTKKKHGPFIARDDISIIAFSPDMSKVFYKVQTHKMRYLYENDSLVFKSENIWEQGYAPDSSIFYVAGPQNNPILYFHGKKTRYLERDYDTLYGLWSQYVFYRDRPGAPLKYESIKIAGEADGLKLSKTDSGFWAIRDLQKIKLDHYVYSSFRSSLDKKDYSYILMKNNRYSIYLNDNLLGTYDTVGEIVFNCNQPEEAEKWAYKARIEGYEYIFTDKRRIGPFKSVWEKSFMGKNKLLIYRVVEKNDSAFIYFGNKKYHCISGDGYFDLSYNQTDVLFMGYRDGRKYRGINDFIYEDEKANYVSRNCYSWKDGQYMSISKVDSMRCIYINGKLVDCYKKIMNFGLTAKGSLFYTARQGYYEYYFINGKQLGPFTNIVDYRHAFDIETVNPKFFRASRIMGSLFLIHEDTTYGPFTEMEWFQEEGFEMSPDSSKIIFKASMFKQPYIFVNHDFFGPHLEIGDYILTAHGPCYYARNDSNTVFLLWNRGILATIPLKYPAMFDWWSLQYNWEYDILQYETLYKKQYINKLMLNDGIYTGQFLYGSNQTEIVYVKGNKLFYKNLK